MSEEEYDEVVERAADALSKAEELAKKLSQIEDAPGVRRAAILTVLSLNLLRGELEALRPEYDT